MNLVSETSPTRDRGYTQVTIQSFQNNPSVFQKEVRQQLRRATLELGQRGMKKSCAWAADLLQTVSSSVANTANENAPDPSSVVNQGGRSGANPDLFPVSRTSDAYLLAKSYFDMAEYKRAAHVLRECTEANKDRLGFFLRFYSLYLAGADKPYCDLFVTASESCYCILQSTTCNEHYICDAGVCTLPECSTSGDQLTNVCSCNGECYVGNRCIDGHFQLRT